MADRERRNLIFAHQEWLGFVQPVGLVVAPTVMVDAQIVPDRNISGRQRAFRALFDPNEEATKVLGVAERHATYGIAGAHVSVPGRVFRDWLGWEDSDLVDAGVHRKRSKSPYRSCRSCSHRPGQCRLTKMGTRNGHCSSA